MRHGRPFIAALLAFAGLGAVAPAALAGQGGQALLPDLVQQTPSMLRIDSVPTTKGPRFHLGFRSAVVNAGTGPLVIEARRGEEAATMTAAQIVRRGGGAPPIVRERAGVLRYTSSPDHRHWHLLDFERYELRTPGGRLAAGDQKTGFCLGDRFDADVFSDWRNEPHTGVFRSECGLDRPDLRRLRQGISVGYGDDYGAQLEGQVVDLTGVPAGSYDLVHRVNADGRLLESRYDNDAACVRLRIAWPGGPASAPLLSQAPCAMARRQAPASSSASTSATTS